MNHDLMANANETPVADELYRTFLKTFQSLQDPMTLVESPLLARPLIQQALQQDEDAIPYPLVSGKFLRIVNKF